MTPSPFIETFPALSAIPGLIHGFTLRSPAIDVVTDRDEALARLMPFFDEQLALAGVSREVLLIGEQVHGKGVNGVDGSSPLLLGISFFNPSAPFQPKARGRRGFGGR